MNAFLKKEIRLLLPGFISGLVGASIFGLCMAMASSFGKRNLSFAVSSLYHISFLLAPCFVVLMSLNSFGREIISGTLPNLLAQPISRAKIWRTKTFLSATAICLVCMAGLFPLFCAGSFKSDAEFRHVVVVFAILFSAVVFSGGLWTALLLRQVAAAFWFTLIVPASLMVPILFMSQKHPAATEPAIIVVLSLYSIAGFVFARWLFLHAQDVQWTGGEISLPGIFTSSKPETSSAIERSFRPRAALLAKELQLHQSQFVMAGALFLLHVGVIAVRKFGDFKDSSGTEFVLNTFWILWFAMPLVVGCAAVAEERKIGTLESQLCLPARRRSQFWIKFLFAMALSLILAVGIPLLLEGSRIVPDFHPKILEAFSQFFLKRVGVFNAAIGNVFAFLHFSMPVLVLLGIAAVMFVVSFYASTLSRNTLQSLAPAVLGMAVAFTMLIGASDVGKILWFVPWRGWLIYLIGVPVLSVTLVWLMSWNFKRVLVDGRVWRRNTAVLLASFTVVVGTTSAVYHRVWDFLTLEEPAHGPARLKSSALVKLETLANTITVQFQNGKVWSGIFVSDAYLTTMFSGNWNLKPFLGKPKFFETTNWKSVAICQSGMFGVQKDGSLWASEKHRNSKAEELRLVRIGHDEDWKAVSGWYPSLISLKRNGTLWRLNTESWNPKKEPWPGIQNFALQRLGTNSDWAEMFFFDWRTAFRDANGRTWAYGFQTSVDAPQLVLDDKVTLYRAEYLDGLKSGAWAWGKSGNFFVGVRNDGKLVVSADFSARNLRREELGIQLGHESDWVAVAGEGETVVSLKADGSLWKWKFKDDPIHHPNSASATRLSRNSDWIAIAYHFAGVIGLASDGTLWLWQFEPAENYVSDRKIPALISAPRQPQRVANIFEDVHSE